jgi:hypothetical protein
VSGRVQHAEMIGDEARFVGHLIFLSALFVLRSNNPTHALA